ncbi:MAG: hypothetical protein GW808_04740 [Sphingomonadales bacterium]|nr:hypothetical protein [Sphingomonadales bacterium]PIX64468.1 MAG: hypothetical protein COZ43_11835 [Sphingomonadales bacterium CG_4_10_14_3_um_filter_58_15]NCO48206.1 hypothetical protein [Sphingomonadales bacterium]NCO99765.1 hypothetical protein [Sphingomonadales bacterium]NCP42415.1 hypothetical protein [Sphingomonadales bacterium]
MTKKVSKFGWLATGLAISGLAMTPALAKVLSGDDVMVSLKTLGSIGSFTVAGADPDLVAKYKLSALRGNASFKFTPSGGTRDGERSVTVVVRQKSDAVSIRENILAAASGSGVTTAAKIAPVSYSLGTAKGLKSFAIPVRKLGSNLPDLSEIGAERLMGDEDSGKKSRFNPRMSIDASAPINAAPRALDASQKDYTLDVGGSYSLTRNLDVTAGLRINNERDRMAPLTDSRQDSQAVYVGTQFRF